MSLCYLSREEWGAVQPKKWNKTTLPIRRVYYMATNTRPCSDELYCIQTCQQLQVRHMERNYGDIRFSFIVGGDGQVYEGRGWNHAPLLPKQHQSLMQRHSILIGFVGRWSNDHLPSLMTRAAGDLIDYGIDNKLLSRDYKPTHLFYDEFSERVVAEYIKESQLNNARKKLRTVNMVKEMGLNNEIVQESDEY